MATGKKREISAAGSLDLSATSKTKASLRHIRPKRRAKGFIVPTHSMNGSELDIKKLPGQETMGLKEKAGTMDTKKGFMNKTIVQKPFENRLTEQLR